MSEYCEYMWDPTRGHGSTELARSIYQEEARLEVKDKKLAIKTVRAILREMPGVDLKQCNDEYITRFLLARKYRTEQAAALIGAYQAQVAHRQDIFGNLTARDPALQRALRAGIPGVLPARDRKGRCVLVMMASQWDPMAVPALSVQRAIFLVLETLIQDPRNQQCGFVIVVDWCNFTLRQGSALGAAALRNLIAALRGRFPARFKGIHFLSAPLYVQATLALVKPFLDEKTRHKIYLHGNNLSTLHQHLPTDILPAELGGTGPSFNAGLWAEPVIHSAMKEAELAVIKKDKALVDRAEMKERHNGDAIRSKADDRESQSGRFQSKSSDMLVKKSVSGSIDEENSKNAEKRGHFKMEKGFAESEAEIILEEVDRVTGCRSEDNRKRIEADINGECLRATSQGSFNEFEMISNGADTEDSRDNSLDSLRTGKHFEKSKSKSNDKSPEERNLIT